MNESTTATVIPKELKDKMQKLMHSAQVTSDLGEEVSRRSIVLDYNRVAARFYEDQILRLKREVEKYQAQVRESTNLHLVVDADLIFSPTETGAISNEFRARMNTPAEDATSTPEEL